MMNEQDGPMQAAQRLMRPELPKRFYKEAGVVEREGGFHVALDGRTAKTPARNALAVPTAALAQALAQEWDAQSERIDPAAMPLTRIVNSALDGVAGEMTAVRGEIVKYAGSDLLCYRAEGPERLVQRQTGVWDPILAWAGETIGLKLRLAEGVMFLNQPEESLAALDRALAGLDAFRLAALHVMTTLSGSAVLAVAVAHGRLSVEEAWGAAHLDEDWNIEQWGADEEAMDRRARRFTEMRAAAKVYALAG